MSKLGKFFLFLIFLIALGSPPVAVKVRDAMQNQEEEIIQLEVKVKDTEEEKKSLETELDAKKKEIAKVKREIISIKQQLSAVKAELKEKGAELNSSAIEKKKLREDAEKLQQEKSTLEEKLAKLTQESNAFRQDISFEEILPDITPSGEMKSVPGQGRVAGVYGNRFITISLNSKIGDVTSPIFVHRRGRVLGKAALKNVYAATIVVEAADRGLLKKISAGDLVQLEGEKLLQPEFFEGRVSKISSHSFASIEVDRRTHFTAQPVFLIYRGNEVLGRIKSKKVISLVIVAELGGIKPGIRVAPKDYLRTPK